jgi:RNA polymerase sigma factor (sigma-70 family)
MGRNLDEAAVKSVYERRYGGFVLGASALLRDADGARDAVQDGFAQALLDRHKWRGGTPEAWIWRIIERKVLDELRRRKRTVSLDEDFDAAVLLPDGDPAVVAAVKSLAPRRRLLVFLHYFADLPYAEIALLCGLAEGTVAATLSQARADLHERLQSEVTQ